MTTQKEQGTIRPFATYGEDIFGDRRSFVGGRIDEEQKIDARLEKTIAAIHATPHKVVIEFAGAGSQAVAWLHGVSGSSRTILEATDRYAEASLIDAIGFEPSQFTSPEVAQVLATTAYRRAHSLGETGTPILGLGCTATIATDRTKRGEHRCCLAVREIHKVTTYELILKKGARSRRQEEEIVSLLMIRALAEACEVSDRPDPNLLAGEVIKVRAEPLTLLMQLLAGEIEWVKIDADGQATTGETLPQIAFLSGAFNPLHQGHRRMVEVASKLLQQEVYFELPLVNAGKAPIGLEEAQRRIAQFEGWATLILSCAPLFSQKAQLFPESVFVIGVDTVQRLLQPRFYHDNPAEMFAALDMIREAGCRFLVAGRLIDAERFVTLADVKLPQGYEDLFEAIPEKEFRIDISSTKIRGSVSSAFD